MLLLTMVYSKERECIIQGIRDLKEYFKNKNVLIGIYENIEKGTHFLKVFCDGEINNKLMNIFNMCVSNIIYNILVDEFYEKDAMLFLSDTYFFLKYEDLEKIGEKSMEVLKGRSTIIDENSIYCINKKNDILNKISDCMAENKEINVDGFITFRRKEIFNDLEVIVDKVVEKYMVEKEYDEFIKLLKYFVDIQESKIDYVNIIIDNDGSYIIKNKKGEEITDNFFRDLTELRYGNDTYSDDVLISALITNSPEKIVIHCVENCKNTELIDTIKKVFTHKVQFCNNCGICKTIKNSLNRV
ncbi:MULTISPECIES: putative sporulation protein YtxC [Clostridium]|uniref:YtxC-like family protein n=5 Tax=Clostridium TaxID=1485 RepID=A0A166SN03_9CLOT|nr:MULTISPECIES: putative sporulation protein YtxC [Clostridium]AGY75573.1 putative sporulation protein YtxC [Clostridium autoethanogenum DSM 10061]ALU35737.1 Sporulation protein YtxC [Clostridium autoethanogenum DSM 10061]OAA89638.1 YtxC-like family protein [Clostridium ljungdahlii DSM 13528]OAA92550.1 YtxC-like family protein [Clostridium coskatii]OBR91479.1 YtxC-like family protein [Clostridium coskatii]